MQASDENIDLLYMLPSYNELQDRFSQEGVAIESTDTLEAFKDQFKSNEALASILGEHLENIEDPNYKKDKELSKAKIVAKVENLENQKSNLEDKVAQAQIQELSALLQTQIMLRSFISFLLSLVLKRLRLEKTGLKVIARHTNHRILT